MGCISFSFLASKPVDQLPVHLYQLLSSLNLTKIDSKKEKKLSLDSTQDAIGKRESSRLG